MSWIQDLFDPKRREWEEFYRNRWQHDKLVRSTHGVNCTGGCSWGVYVKDGIVTWEEQMTNYPCFDPEIPPYEPRGCQRGISFSWYIYSPLRVKYPYIRGTLIDLWREARKKFPDPVDAWKSVQDNPEARQAICTSRGKGGFRRASWDEALEIIGASTIHTIKKYGPDRIVGFSPIPAMSMLSYAAGSRMLQLMGGTVLSFYDWYSDLPPASPEIWGEQTDVAESADWYNSKFIAVMGSNPSMTRTPDVHYLAEARYKGSKVVLFSPDFNQTTHYSDWWIPLHAGQDGAFWMSVVHVILKEFHHDNKSESFLDYVKKYTDSPFLVELVEDGGKYTPGRMLRASSISKYKNEENSEWKFLAWDKTSNKLVMPKGTIGFRWQEKKGQWNLEQKDGVDNSDFDAELTFLENHDEVLTVEFEDHAKVKEFKRGIPVRYVETEKGRIPVATIYDLIMGQYGVGRGLPGYPESYDDEDATFTPAWQEQFTGIDKETAIQFAREWASTAEKTGGKCSIIIGAGINHWFHNNLIYRSAIMALMLCGCVGKNGGGLNHYVGQEKVAPLSAWVTLAMALDWNKPPKLQNTPSFHYVHSGQWKYETPMAGKSGPEHKGKIVGHHTMDTQIKAVKSGWLPFYPNFNRNPIQIIEDAKAEGATELKDVQQWVIKQLQDGKLKFVVEDPDAPENWPRTWFIWRGNAIMSSGKGHEYFLKHYLGTHHNSIADELAEGSVEDAIWRESPKGKFDLVVDINFRMDTTALYSDIVLPTATWYEKNDLNSTDLHTYIHPLSEAVPPCWESKSDWDIFKAVAKKVSELAVKHIPEPVKELVATPLLHDTPAELAQPSVKDWWKGECDPIPGKTMPGLAVVERDYVNLYNKFISLGKLDSIGMHGISWDISDLYHELFGMIPTEVWGGEKYPSVKDAVDAADVILHLAPETNGESAYRAWEAEEKKTGMPLKQIGEDTRAVRMRFKDIQAQPRRFLTTPCWTGDIRDGRTYSSYVTNVENKIPWRTLTGRQHFYLDHEGYIEWKENLPTYKAKPAPTFYGDIVKSKPEGNAILLNYLTPHCKWTIHSTYYDNLRMLTLSRGLMPFWIGDGDAEKIGIVDNDWVEIYNDHGVVVTRAVVSHRIPDGICMIYHAPERTISIPKSPLRGNKRGGAHNSLIRARLKPVLMMGGYGHFTYFFNYWGPTGVNRDTHVYVRKLEGEPKW